MIDKAKEIFEDYKGRIKNPLIASFILIWLYKHWSLLFWVLASDEKISIYMKIDKVQEYIDGKGWLGMVLYPFLISCFAMPAYFLIANLAQWVYIWVGKRLNAEIVSRADAGLMIKKTELNKEKDKAKVLKKNIEDLTLEVDNLTQFKQNSYDIIEKYENESKQYKVQLTTAKTNINFNEKFQEQFIYTLIYLLGKSRGQMIEGIINSNIVNYNLSLLKGSWELQKHDFIESTNFQTTALNINDSKVTRFNDEKYGRITDFTIDQSTKICELTIEREDGQQEKSTFFQVNSNLFKGISEGKYVVLSRKLN